MTFTSLLFLIFVVGVVFIYYIVPKKWQWAILLLASYGFYLSSGTDNVLFILFTTMLTYGAGLFMQKLRDDNQAKIAARGDDITKEEKREMKKAVSKRIRVVQVVTVLLSLAVLAYVKYLNFFIGCFNDLFTLFKWDASVPYVNIIAPLGISYFTFNTIGYIVDIGRGKYKAERHIGKFALFVSFFPSIVQGPLLRFSDVGMQLQQPHKFDYDNVAKGIQLMLWGFFKKLVIADRVAIIANTVFASGYSGYNGSEIFLGVLAYSFQIYGDFSGGTDITRGVAQMMGIDLPLNFERPFFATSMANFWQRWHMSLGAWMREFVFYPVMLCKPVTNLSKKMRKRFGPHAAKIVPSVAAPFVVFFLMNIWHGLSAQRIVNGLYNALIISSSVALAPVYKKITEKLRINTESFSFRLFQILRTFFVLCISRILTKAPSMTDALKMIKELFTSFDLDLLFGLEGKIFSYGIGQREMFVLLLALLILLVVGILQENGMKIRDTIAKQGFVFRWGIYLILIAVILVFGVYGPGYDAAAFIYGGY